MRNQRRAKPSTHPEGNGRCFLSKMIRTEKQLVTARSYREFPHLEDALKELISGGQLSLCDTKIKLNEFLEELPIRKTPVERQPGNLDTENYTTEEAFL